MEMLGVMLAFLAMIGWGFGDYFLQKSIRKVGDWETLFIVTFIGAIALTPFIWKEIIPLFSNSKLWILFLASFVLLIGALLDFEALKKGKLAIVEPIWSMEIPVSAILAYFIIGELVGLYQIIIIIFLILGLVLVSIKSEHFTKSAWLERGVFLALLAALSMGAANFFIGWGSRESSALMMNWFLNVFLAIISFVFIFIDSDVKSMFKHFKKQKFTWLGMVVFDNVAWISFAFAMVMAPIAITVAISESYIVIAVILGMYLNKEKLKIHQKLGILVAIVAAIILALTIG